jgi:hypothetical protein
MLHMYRFLLQGVKDKDTLPVIDATLMLVTVVITTSVAGCICAICTIDRIIAFFDQDDANVTPLNEALIADVAE